MRIEKEKIVVAPLNPVEIEKTQVLKGQTRNLRLTPYQQQILSRLSSSGTIEAFIKDSIQQSVLPLFRELYRLLEFMSQEGLIMTPSYRTFFRGKEIKKAPAIPEPPAFVLDPKLGSDLKERLKVLPLFRSLKETPLLDLLLTRAKAHRISKGLYICQQGRPDRSLFVLLEGQASVYKDTAGGGFGRVGILHAGSVFGEVGFLLGDPRSAHIMADENCVIARIEYDASLFDGAIKKERAGVLQKRFWVIHALLRSPLFRQLPQDSFDDFIFAGELREHVAGELLCQEGESGDSCSIIIQGDFLVTVQGKVVRHLTQGDTFGEIALMKTGGLRTATVQSKTDSITLEIGYERFYDLLSENLILACQFERQAEALLGDSK